MPVYLVTGKLGAGKSLVSVGRMQEFLRDGRRVATNLDLTLENFLASKARVSCIRLPDKPMVEDLIALGNGNESMDESRNGVIVLDELGTWLNARDWGDKGRRAVVDWLIHSRKYGWDVYLICQHISQIDKQIRETIVEYLVICRRLDRLRMPFVGSLIAGLTGGLLSGRLPRVHVASVRYGCEVGALVADRWWFVGNHLFGAYNTRQVFSSSYAHGIYSYLSPWHLVGRHKVGLWDALRTWWRGERRSMTRSRPAARLWPLMRLAPDMRVLATRRLIERGLL